MAKKKAAVAAQRTEAELKARFAKVVGSIRPEDPPPERADPTDDQKLSNSLAEYLQDDRAKVFIVWLESEAKSANERAHIAAGTERRQEYSLGQESAYRSAAHKLKVIRGEV